MKKTIILLLAFSNSHGQSINSFHNEEIKLYYEVKGKGPALYILTGGPGAPPEHPSYELMDSLATHHTCVLLHQRGS